MNKIDFLIEAFNKEGVDILNQDDLTQEQIENICKNNDMTKEQFFTNLLHYFNSIKFDFQQLLNPKK